MKRLRQRREWRSTWLLLAATLWCVPRLVPAAPLDFVRDVQPIFTQHCVSCHGPEKQKGGLRLDVRPAALKGGDAGVAITPGKSGDSLLIRLVMGVDPDKVMPAKGGRLTPQQIATLRDWIDQGANWPDTLAGLERSPHWSLQPLNSPGIPGRALDLDTFILARLATNGLAQAPEADRATLIRRLSYDLIGLPPTPPEIEAFIRDQRTDAYARLVDRLLASPRYGERWARHWLDVARYTESQGFEYDKLRDNAWHYRDYVIKSFNDDKPYDRFMREQIAGDVADPVTVDSITGASLLVCGPWDEAGNGQANATQKAITREEELEDLISVVGQTFLGLTINCARCHSHKFDPIPHEEYYRIKSVFEGVKHGERPLATPAGIKEREARIAKLKIAQAEAEAAVARIEAEGNKAAVARQSKLGTNSPGPVSMARWKFDGSTNTVMPGELKGGARMGDGRLRLMKDGEYYQTAPLPRDLREKTLEAWVALADLRQGGGAVISVEHEDGSQFDAIVFGERQPRKWTAGSAGFQRTRDLDGPEENTPPTGLIHVAVVYRSDNSVAVFRNGEPYGKPYTPGSPLQIFKAGQSHVVLGLRHKGGGKPYLRGEIKQASLYDRALSNDEVAASFRSGGFVVSREEMLASLTEEQRREREVALAQLTQVRAELKSVPPLPVSYVGTRIQPAPTRRLKRGDVKSPDEIVTPGALSAVFDLKPDFGLPADAPEAQRRIAFADWLCDRRNPLPARVMANRVWHLHFGQGIVSTPNDLGLAGARPTHPELLDWLAIQFIESGWSVKALHRLIVNSATYRQAGTLSARGFQKAFALDADNQLLWRFPPRRLEAETLRDAMLAVSGELNLQAGGPSFRPFEVQKFPANAYAPVDRAEPQFNRRTVYRMNVNSGKEPLLDAFDCPHPSVKTPRRGVTTTPLQALALMNNSFVQRQADKLAARAMTEAKGDLAGAIQTAYRLTFAREATRSELKRATSAAKERGLPHVCWALLNSTEFVYVR